MSEIPCNCYHQKKDHKDLGTNEDGEFISWCVWSEIGQCPCDYFTPMDNLEYLEWKSSLSNGK